MKNRKELSLLSDPSSSGLGVKPQEQGKHLEKQWLESICREAGADDVGFVELDRREIDDQRSDILAVFPPTKTLISFVCRMNREPIRSPARSIANLEFHRTGDRTNEVARRIVAKLESKGIRAINPAMGFPMEMERFPGKIWTISHKPIAVAAGLGKMGIHRNVIHPQFGNFILLGTVAMEGALLEVSQPLDYNPCLECKLCVAACPVGAIGSDGYFNFSACYTHNYREFMGGFTDWIETVSESRSRHHYRTKVGDAESASMWQSLSFGANYKAAYCMAVCPAGEEVLGPFTSNRQLFLKEVVKPLQHHREPVFVLSQSDAEEHVQKRFPHKSVKRVGNSLRPRSIQGFKAGLWLVFQPHQAKGVHARFHFTFFGLEEQTFTVSIQDKTLAIEEGLVGEADCQIVADSATWVGFLRREKSLLWALICRTVRIHKGMFLLKVFAQCFPR